MDTVYKVTTRSLTTNGGNCKWEIGKRKKICGYPAKVAPYLCSRTVFHAYAHPFHAWAYLGNMCGAKGLRLFEATGTIVVRGSNKVGCRSLRLVKELSFPKLSNTVLVDMLTTVANAYIPYASSPSSPKNFRAAIRDQVRLFFKAAPWRLRRKMCTLYDKLVGAPKDKVRTK